MKTNNLNIFEHVINQDLCVGCGACIYQTHSEDFKMNWNQEGFLVPIRKNDSVQIPTYSIQVCPFNPFPSEEVRNENELANFFLNDAPRFHQKVGKYFNTYVGYSEQFRLTSSSGGIATYILNELFEKKLVDAVVTVGEGINNSYEYKLIKRKEDLLATSKTKYYPVSMGEVLNELDCFNGKVAVVGIGCFIKAIRLLQFYNPSLKEKIVFTIGIICGGLKSKFFSEYLASKAGVKNNDFIKPIFRIKDFKNTAGDYSFGCIDGQGIKRQVKMKTVGDMWGSGMFKCNACDFCDDVTTELPDISLGDAWIEPHIHDPKGTNIIITRSNIAEKLLSEGLNSRAIFLKSIDLDLFIKSQQGSYNHRHTGLNFRSSLATRKGKLVPIKRQWKSSIFLVDFNLVQLYRMKVRKLSLIYWLEFGDAVMFDLKIKNVLLGLKKTTKIYHYRQAIFSRKFINKIFNFFLKNSFKSFYL